MSLLGIAREGTCPTYARLYLTTVRQCVRGFVANCCSAHHVLDHCAACRPREEISAVGTLASYYLRFWRKPCLDLEIVRVSPPVPFSFQREIGVQQHAFLDVIRSCATLVSMELSCHNKVCAGSSRMAPPLGRAGRSCSTLYALHLGEPSYLAFGRSAAQTQGPSCSSRATCHLD